MPVESGVANAYGNTPRGAIKKWLNRKDTFLGKINGTYGVWQRPRYEPKAATKGRSRKLGRVDGLSNTTGKLKLVIAIHDPVQTKKRLEFAKRGETVVLQNFNKVFGQELAKAIASAK